MRILIITPYLHKARQQLNRIITKRVNNGCTVVKAIADQYGENREVIFDDETELQFVLALPDEVSAKIRGMYYDVVFIDKEYNDDEVRYIRVNLIGTESKPVIYF